MAKPKPYPPPDEQPFVAHLVELRDRLLRSVLAIIVVFLCMFPFANDLYTFLAEPLLRHMPQGTSMIATEVASPFLTPFKLALVLSIFVCMPVLLFQAWAFIAPGLYQNERKLVFPLMLTSTMLFYLGMVFAYYVVFPLVFGFLTAVAPEGVAVMTDISKYLDFVLKMFFAFGVAFEVPVATILVIWAGITTAESLAAKRPYVIVSAFVIGMLLTPPDVISQTLLALPMWFLFELGLIFSRAYTKDQKQSPDSGSHEKDKPEATPPHSTPSQGFNSDDESTATDYGDTSVNDYQEPSEQEMDDELDRMDEFEKNEFKHEGPPHKEYEPFPEDEEQLSGHQDDSGDTDSPDEDKSR